MPATFNWAQVNGTAPGSITELSSSGNVVNYMTEDAATPSDYSSFPIAASDGTNQGNSYEVVMRGHWQGTFTSIQNLRFWKSTDFSPSTGLTDKYGVVAHASYTRPGTETSSIATATMPTSQPGTANISIAGSLSGTLGTAGYSDDIYLQLHVATTASAGDTSLAAYSLLYDET